MKIILPLSMVAILIVIILSVIVSMDSTRHMTVVSEGNTKKLPIDMLEGRFQCSECGMVINKLNFASQVISSQGKTWFFDDHGCMAAWVKSANFQEEPEIWVTDLISGKWIDGRSAWYSRNDTTPMMYGFGAYSDSGEQFIEFDSMQSYMLRGETYANPTVRKQLLGE